MTRPCNNAREAWQAYLAMVACQARAARLEASSCLLPPAGKAWVDVMQLVGQYEDDARAWRDVLGEWLEKEAGRYDKRAQDCTDER